MEFHIQIVKEMWEGNKRLREVSWLSKIGLEISSGLGMQNQQQGWTVLLRTNLNIPGVFIIFLGPAIRNWYL